MKNVWRNFKLFIYGITTTTKYILYTHANAIDNNCEYNNNFGIITC